MSRADKTSNPLLASTLDCASRGWPTIPLKAGDKRPSIAGGYKSGTTDPERLIEIWTEQPNANVGIVTGAPSGILALDIDPRNGGNESLATLVKKHGALPPTVKARTGGGGEHYLFKIPDGVEVRSCVLADGIDLKANGGYIVAPPSIHPNGTKYQWEVSPHEIELAAPPDWLMEPPKKLRPSLVKQETQSSVDAADTPLGKLFSEQHLLGKSLDDGKRAVACPWDNKHSGGRVFDSSTVIFPSNKPEGLGGFHCSHSHCSHRTSTDAFKELTRRRELDHAKNDWQGELKRSEKTGAIRNTFRNCYLILRNDESYGKKLRADEMRGAVLLDKVELTDSGISALRIDLNQRA